MAPDYSKQRDALVSLSVAYEGARDFTRRVLRTASQPQTVQRFLREAKGVFRKVLRDIEDAQVALVASGFCVPRSWIIIDPLDKISGYYLGVCAVDEIVESAAAEDSALEEVLKDIAKDVRLLKGATPGAKQSEGTGEEEPPKPKNKRRGRKRIYDPRKDKQIAEAWETGPRRNKTEFGKAFGLTKNEVERTLDRHRKRTPKRRDTSE
jgi:hypothetical protein